MVGEDIATAYLMRNGYEIIDRNWRIGDGEIDIIAKKENIIVFVEVKTAYSDVFGDPIEWVNKAKQRQIGKIAAVWLAQNDPGDCFFRFDVIALKGKGGDFDIEHMEDAFIL